MYTYTEPTRDEMRAEMESRRKDIVEVSDKLNQACVLANKMTAAFCAVLDELERRGIADEVAASASSDKIDVSDLLRSHREYLAKNK